jgi:hypothetical protein
LPLGAKALRQGGFGLAQTGSAVALGGILWNNGKGYKRGRIFTPKLLRVNFFRIFAKKVWTFFMNKAIFIFDNLGLIGCRCPEGE